MLKDAYHNPNKIYVRVNATFERDGKLTPTAIIWEDDERYEIDKVLDVRRAASLKAGGVGVRYTIRLQGRERFLFRDEDRWFVERKG